jgi:hypothetical protein
MTEFLGDAITTFVFGSALARQSAARNSAS